MLFTGMLDLIMVTRSNKQIGVPDELVVLISDSTLSPMMQRLLYVPMFVLAARVCPLGAEATVFAMFMSLSNFGSSISIYLGSFLVFMLGITDTNFDNLPYLIIIRSVARLVPIPIILWLVPNGAPQENDESARKSSLVITHFSTDRHSNIGRYSSQARHKSMEDDLRSLRNLELRKSNAVLEKPDESGSNEEDIKNPMSLRGNSTSQSHDKHEDDTGDKQPESEIVLHVTGQIVR
jgi:hypothetical protein